MEKNEKKNLHLNVHLILHRCLIQYHIKRSNRLSPLLINKLEFNKNNFLKKFVKTAEKMIARLQSSKRKLK